MNSKAKEVYKFMPKLNRRLKRLFKKKLDKLNKANRLEDLKKLILDIKINADK